MKKLLLLLCYIALLFTFSCKNDDNLLPPETSEEEQPITPINFEENYGTTISARFLGRVVNEQNEPIQGVTVRVGNTVTTTDLFGIFSVENATAYEKFAYITAEKEGYILGSRALAPSATEVNRVEIMLLKEDVIATINSGQEATVNLSNGTEVTFEGNFVKSDGSSYNGEVNVILKHLDPDDENMEAMMPGMLFAQDANGAAVALETYGMLAVELKSGTGEELQLAEGSMSQISMPISANTNNPPSTIPLWHFDEEQGYWVEEGEATLQGNKYVGDVGHFSFWNYDYPYPSVYVCIELQDENGDPLSYTPIDLYSSLLNSTGTYGFTNANGVECGLVPAGEELTVIVPEISCNGESFTTTIGPFSQDTTTTITVSDTTVNTTTLTGTFVTCEGVNVTDGYLQLFLGNGTVIIPVTNGTFSYTVAYCDTLDYSIKGIDITNNQVTDVMTGTFNGETTIDLGVLSSCTGFVDTDGDGIFDSFEDLNGDNDLTNDDTDDDGIPNYLDEDDDGDGINTADEDYDGDNDPTNDDTDGDQIPNYLDAQDVNVYDTEVPGEGCDPLMYNLDDIVTNYYSGQGAADLTYTFYENEADAISGTNPITVSTYEVSLANVLTSPVSIFIKGTSTITGQSAIAMVYLYYDYQDTDNDGLTDCEETTGIDNPYTTVTPNGVSDPNDPNDPYNTLVLTLGDTTVSESSGSVDIIASVNVAPIQDITIFFGTNDDTAIAGEDYEAVSGTYTIPAGQTSITITILITDDTEVEGNESFLITGEITNSNIFVNNTVTILDDDQGSNFPQSGSLETCEGNGNGVADFDLTTMDSYYLNGSTGTVSYHQTQADADANTNAVASPATVGNGFTFFVRIESQGIVQISTLTLFVNSIPTTPTGLSLTECDGNSDGLATFNISQLDAQIVQGQSGIEVNYYETQADATNNVNPLISTNYTNSTPSQQTIFYREEDVNTGCYNIGTINLLVDPGC